MDSSMEQEAQQLESNATSRHPDGKTSLLYMTSWRFLDTHIVTQRHGHLLDAIQPSSNGIVRMHVLPAINRAAAHGP